jgi:hypothetical protein
MPSERFVGATELAAKSSVLLRDITASGEACYITEGGKAKAVLMDIQRYHALMDLVEEAENFRDTNHSENARKHVSVRTILRNACRHKKSLEA